MQQLLLTLGHNSSAILMEDGQLVCGYETERVTGLKSDSRFPAPVIEYMIDKGYFRRSQLDMVYVSHWAPSGRLADMLPRHWDPEYFDGVPIRTLSTDLTHHDAHMWAARCYAGDHFPTDAHIMVVDGFGTCGEHFSIYETHNGFPKLLYRVHGYETSLGLWYQYATAFMGMKMHEDEYKLLGYEAHVNEQDADDLTDDAMQKCKLWLQAMDASPYGSRYDPVYDISALANVKNLFFSHLTEICHRHDIADPTSFEGRCKLAFYVQSVLERVVLSFVGQFRMKNVVLTGGCFHNVKLNLMVADNVDGQVCVMPLCGDQGNGLGLYAKDHPEFKFPPDLFWGKRQLKDVGSVAGLTVVASEAEALPLIDKALKRRGYVNLVRGAMEFGPRALCNTSTLALPHIDIVDRINNANDRNSVMPMAPVVTARQYRALFDNVDHVWKSHAHMIMAMEYKNPTDENIQGIVHRYNWPQPYGTGRPQMVDESDTLMTQLLDGFGPLINTSFNFHGQPIALDMETVIKNHTMQYQRDQSFETIVIAS